MALIDTTLKRKHVLVAVLAMVLALYQIEVDPKTFDHEETAIYKCVFRIFRRPRPLSQFAICDFLFFFSLRWIDVALTPIKLLYFSHCRPQRVAD